jgi:hypothetical protein
MLDWQRCIGASQPEVWKLSFTGMLKGKQKNLYEEYGFYGISTFPRGIGGKYIDKSSTFDSLDQI